MWLVGLGCRGMVKWISIKKGVGKRCAIMKVRLRRGIE